MKLIEAVNMIADFEIVNIQSISGQVPTKFALAMVLKNKFSNDEFAHNEDVICVSAVERGVTTIFIA